jgi:hypothetical protein
MVPDLYEVMLAFCEKPTFLLTLFYTSVKAYDKENFISDIY